MKYRVFLQDFVHRTREPRYFVRWLFPDDIDYQKGFRYRIELLTEDGCAGADVVFTGDEVPLEHSDPKIPEAVFRAAFGRTNNPGDYVNSDGTVAVWSLWS